MGWLRRPAAAVILPSTDEPRRGRDAGSDGVSGVLRKLADIDRDMRYALRAVRRNPGFAAAVIFTLALGIGANTAVFSVVNTLPLQPLPCPDPARIVMLVNTWRGNITTPGVSVPKFTAWRQSTSQFADVAAYTFGRTVDLSRAGDPRPVTIGRVTAGFFRLFGARIALGRSFIDTVRACSLAARREALDRLDGAPYRGAAG